MKAPHLTEFGIRAPWLVLVAVIALVIGLGSQFPKVHFDNNPENMLAADEPVRLFHRAVTDQYDLYDFVVAGVVNTEHEDGVFNVETLTRLHQLTEELISLQPDEQGRPMVKRDGAAYTPDLAIKGKRQQVLAKAFHHDPEDLFDEQGGSAIISREIIAPSVVDNIVQADLGQLKIAYLMERAPTNRAEALEIRDDAMNNPLYKGTLVSEDGQAVGLYVPIIDKHYSHNVAALIEALTTDWPAEDRVYITGLPVAEDTFGIEMLVQMATSAPLAGLAIFLLLWMFFRKISLIIAPMLVAIASVVSTMGLLIGLGFDVHIMSSMIAIFLMPIAVADSVHILSEFFDTYPRFKDKAATLRHVLGHLFKPMLYTSLTTMAGFASLGLTPIPPVRVFGLHVAFGVGLAWLLSIILIPAYVMLFVPRKALDSLQKDEHAEGHRSLLDPFLEKIGRFAHRQAVPVLVIAGVLLGIAAYGISLININDNPVNWFTKNHRIRVADKVLNHHFGGTYTAYLTVKAAPDQPEQALADRVREALGSPIHPALSEILDAPDEATLFARLYKASTTLDATREDSWNLLADTINYLDPEGLDGLKVSQALNNATNAVAEDSNLLLREMSRQREVHGAALQNHLLDFCDAQLAEGISAKLETIELSLTAPLLKRPELLAYIEDLQSFLAENERVGKSSSVVDALKKANYELNFEESLGDANQAFYAIPDSPAAVAQVYTQLEGMKKKDSLFHMVTRAYDEANIWVQLTTGNNQDMALVEQSVAAYLDSHPAPYELESGWAGLTYINVVWQDKMVRGMLSSLGSSFIVVFIMMTVLFRSPLYGLLSMIPLSITIALTYGIIGLVGKDYDMPVAVLSALTLGLSIDFAIHFLQRARETTRSKGSWSEAVGEMFKEPAKAISRNAIVIAVGFTPLLFAPLVPYRTVGFFLATIMLVSWLATMFMLTALATLFQKRLFN